MRPVRIALVVVALASCSVFDESMRRHDAGAPASSASATSAPTTGGSGSSSGSPGDACFAANVPIGQRVDNCGGKGGGLFDGGMESEPNDGAAEPLSRGHVVCGQAAGADVDRFELAVQTGDCTDVFVDLSGGSGGTVTIDAPGGTRTSSTTVDVPLKVASDGKITVTISGEAAYKVLIR